MEEFMAEYLVDNEFEDRSLSIVKPSSDVYGLSQFRHKEPNKKISHPSVLVR